MHAERGRLDAAHEDVLPPAAGGAEERLVHDLARGERGAVRPGRHARERAQRLRRLARDLARAVAGGALAEDDQVVGLAGGDQHLLEPPDQRREQHGGCHDERDAARGEGGRPAPDEEVADVVGERDRHAQKRRRSASTTLSRAPFHAGTRPATNPTVSATASPSAATGSDMRKLARGPR